MWERFTPTVTLESAGPPEYFRRGDRAEPDIRGSTVDGIADTGAVTLVRPQNHAERLGLHTPGTPFVTSADERREERPLARPVVLQIGNRSMTMDCILGPPLSDVLIGQVVLQRLNLIADSTNRTLPLRYEDYPLLNLKALAMRRCSPWDRSSTTCWTVAASRPPVLGRHRLCLPRTGVRIGPSASGFAQRPRARAAAEPQPQAAERHHPPEGEHGHVLGHHHPAQRSATIRRRASTGTCWVTTTPRCNAAHPLEQPLSHPPKPAPVRPGPVPPTPHAPLSRDSLLVVPLITELRHRHYWASFTHEATVRPTSTAHPCSK